MTSSEGGIAGLYCGISDVAPMGDDAKITDQMPFFNVFGYMPTEISVATGGYEKRGSLWAWAIVVNKDNPLNEITLDQLDRTFGSERSGGWELVNHNWMYSAKYARGADTNIRSWDQLGLTGDFAGKEIMTFGYCAPGFEIAIQRTCFTGRTSGTPTSCNTSRRSRARPARGQRGRQRTPARAALEKQIRHWHRRDHAREGLPEPEGPQDRPARGRAGGGADA